MNYILESKAFYESIELNQLSAGQIALWHALLDIANKSQWQEWISVPNIVLKLHTGLSVQGINKARNLLKQYGYIDFKISGNRKATRYRLLQLYVSNSSSNSSKNSSSNSSSNSSKNSLTYINKTKQDKTKLFSQESAKPTPKKNQPAKKRVYEHGSVEYLLADRLKQKIMDNAPDHKPITEARLQKWADTMRLMIERDHRQPDKIKNLIDWCQDDDFWKTNILSANALRRQYDRLRLKALDDWKKGNVDPLDFEARNEAGKASDDEYMRRYEHEFD